MVVAIAQGVQVATLVVVVVAVLDVSPVLVAVIYVLEVLGVTLMLHVMTHPQPLRKVEQYWLKVRVAKFF